MTRGSSRRSALTLRISDLSPLLIPACVALVGSAITDVPAQLSSLSWFCPSGTLCFEKGYRSYQSFGFIHVVYRDGDYALSDILIQDDIELPYC